jgi:hypothetical protein
MCANKCLRRDRYFNTIDCLSTWSLQRTYSFLFAIPHSSLFLYLPPFPFQFHLTFQPLPLIFDSPTLTSITPTGLRPRHPNQHLPNSLLLPNPRPLALRMRRLFLPRSHNLCRRHHTQSHIHDSRHQHEEQQLYSSDSNWSCGGNVRTMWWNGVDWSDCLRSG